jgi:hypothetical protein
MHVRTSDRFSVGSACPAIWTKCPMRSEPRCPQLATGVGPERPGNVHRTSRCAATMPLASDTTCAMIPAGTAVRSSSDTSSRSPGRPSRLRIDRMFARASRTTNTTLLLGNVACNRALQERRIRFLEDACREIPRMTRREHAEVGFTAPQARRRSSPQRSGTSSVAETARCSARSAATAVVPDFWCQGRRPAPRHPEEQPARFPRTRADRLVCVPRGAIVASRASGGIAANGRRCARPTGAEPSVTEPASS